jgi:hypothetical protein
VPGRPALVAGCGLIDDPGRLAARLRYATENGAYRGRTGDQEVAEFLDEARPDPIEKRKGDTTMKKLSPILMIAALALPLTGCMQHTYVAGGSVIGEEIVYKHWHHHWLFGLIRPKLQEEVDIDKLCPSGDFVIHQEVSFANGIVDILTAFIYSPTTVTVRCASSATEEMATLELTEKEVVEIASDPRFHRVVEHLAPERLEELEEALAAR